MGDTQIDDRRSLTSVSGVHTATKVSQPWTRPSSPGSHKGNGEKEKFIALWRKGRRREKGGTEKVVAIGEICFYRERNGTEAEKRVAWIECRWIVDSSDRIEKLHFRDAAVLVILRYREKGKTARRSYESVVRLLKLKEKNEDGWILLCCISRAIILFIK